MVKAAVMAGGKGTRFRPYTDLIPKPMIPVGPLEKPILEYIVNWLYRHGVREYVFLVGHRWRQIYNYFGDGSRFGVRIEYSIDEPPYGNTGGALLQAVEKGLLDGTILVWYGDILAELDVSALLEVHRGRGASATLAVASSYRVPVGVAEVGEDGLVSAMREKPLLPVKATIGVLAVEAEAVRGLAPRLGKSFDLMGDLIPLMIEEGHRVAAYVYEGPWYDVGSLERYQKLPEEELREFLTTTWP